MQNNRKWDAVILLVGNNSKHNTKTTQALKTYNLKVNLLQTAINSPSVFSCDKHLTNTPLFQKGSIYKVKYRHA